MGIYTTFFAAEPSKLASAFPGWSAPKRVKRRFKNPFTGEDHGIRTFFEPSERGARVANIPKKWPQYEHKFLLPLELRPLLGGCVEGWPLNGMELLDADVSAKEFEEPLIMASPESVLHEVPRVLVGALRDLDDKKLPRIAKAWSSKLVVAETPYALDPRDAASVLAELRRVARAAKGEMSMYAYLNG